MVGEPLFLRADAEPLTRHVVAKEFLYRTTGLAEVRAIHSEVSVGFSRLPVCHRLQPVGLQGKSVWSAGLQPAFVGFNPCKPHRVSRPTRKPAEAG